MKIYFPFRWIGVARARQSLFTVNVECDIPCTQQHIDNIFIYWPFLLPDEKVFQLFRWNAKHVAVNVVADAVVLANSAFSCTQFYLFKCNWISTRHNNRLAEYSNVLSCILIKLMSFICNLIEWIYRPPNINALTFSAFDTISLSLFISKWKWN